MLIKRRGARGNGGCWCCLRGEERGAMVDVGVD